MKLLKKLKGGLIISERYIDNALDIAQEYISKQTLSKVDEQTTSGSTKHKQSHLKLPKLLLPKFDEDVLKFQNFWINSRLLFIIMTMCLLFRSSPTCAQYLKGSLIEPSKDLKSLVLIIITLLMI